MMPQLKVLLTHGHDVTPVSVLPWPLPKETVIACPYCLYEAHGRSEIDAHRRLEHHIARDHADQLPMEAA